MMTCHTIHATNTQHATKYTTHTAPHIHTRENTQYTHNMHTKQYFCDIRGRYIIILINILLIWFSIIISWFLPSFFSLISIYFQQNVWVRKAVNTIATEFFREKHALLNRIQYLLKRFKYTRMNFGGKTPYTRLCYIIVKFGPFILVIKSGQIKHLTYHETILLKPNNEFFRTWTWWNLPIKL